MIYPPRFALWEIAIAIDPHGPFDKMECEIVKPLHEAIGHVLKKDGIRGEISKGLMYGVKFACEPRVILAYPTELKKRPGNQKPEGTEDGEDAPYEASLDVMSLFRKKEHV